MIPDAPSLSVVVLSFEWAGVSLNALLFFFLARSVKRVYLDYWALGWLSLSLALASLYLSLDVASEPRQALYFLGEYVFGLLLVGGCRSYVSDARLEKRHLWLLLPAAGVAAALARFESGFSVRYVGQAAVMAGLYGYGLVQLERIRGRRPGAGLAITRVALALLSLIHLHYVFVYTDSIVSATPLPFAYAAFNAVFDLILLTVLAFGMVVLALEGVRGEMELANRELRAARDRLERMVRHDPLTDALSRHAFEALVEERSTGGGKVPSGCAAVVDVDELKQVNDRFGHPAGDDVIRAVASAIRRVVRAADPVFRWGGDEFLVLLPAVGEAEALQRLGGLNPALARTSVRGCGMPLTIRVSFGVAAFSEATPLERAIAAADEAMYRNKQARKGGASAPDALISPR